MKYLGLFPDVPDLKGCSDGGCVFRPPTGMRTNGGCACMKRGADPLRLQLNLQRISRHMESMRAELDDARRQNNDLHALLSELRAVVRGECPSLLDEDSDGFGDLAIRIDAALGEKP